VGLSGLGSWLAATRHIRAIEPAIVYVFKIFAGAQTLRGFSTLILGVLSLLTYI